MALTHFNWQPEHGTGRVSTLGELQLKAAPQHLIRHSRLSPPFLCRPPFSLFYTVSHAEHDNFRRCDLGRPRDFSLESYLFRLERICFQFKTEKLCFAAVDVPSIKTGTADVDWGENGRWARLPRERLVGLHGGTSGRNV